MRFALKLLPWMLVVGVVTIVGVARWRQTPVPPRPEPVQLIGSLRGPVSSPDGLATRIAQLEQRLQENDEDTGARIALAEVLVRQARVAGNAALAARAEDHLKQALRADPGDYEAQRMLGLVLLSLHRFEDAITAGERAKTIRPDDAWNYGVIGDGQLELGRYDEAFTAFQRMMDLRPNAASYARASYALELQGQLDAALEAMQRAINATSPRDAEGLAWTIVHAGDLLFRMGRIPEAEAHYQLAARVFDNHPFAIVGMARIAAFRNQDDKAIDMATTVLGRAPSIGLAAFVGDLHARNGRPADAERYYAMADVIGRESGSTDESFAGFLAERGRRIEDAVRLAEAAVRTRQDVRSLDALAWSYFRSGRLDDAREASTRALRTGTRDKKIVMHAAAIAAAAGDTRLQQELLTRAAPRDPDFDVAMARDLVSLMARSGAPTVAAGGFQ